MSWLDKTNNDLIIITGDSQEYKPSWVSARKQKEYNISEFDFPRIPGTLVNRREPRGRRYTLEIYFQGPDHLDICAAFETSADNKSPWIIQHPLYDVIFAHPVSLDIDNTAHNVSKITIPIIETIVEGGPLLFGDEFNLPEEIRVSSERLNVSFETSITSGIRAPDINNLNNSNATNYSRGVKIITLPTEFEAYYNLFNTANTYVSTAIASPLLAIRATISLLTYPAKFTASVSDRVNMIMDELNTLRNNVEAISNVSSKQLYQAQAGSTIGAICLAVATPLLGNYTNKAKVLNIIDNLKTVHDQYITDLDGLQSNDGGDLDSFIPDWSSLIELNSLYNFTVANLFTIALSSKMEKSIITEYDTNVIILTHRLYGLDNLDANLDELIANNEIGLNGLLQVRKGTRIVYYT
jgi:hypothetical protein